MVTFLLFIAFVIGFVYLTNRIDRLERALRQDVGHPARQLQPPPASFIPVPPPPQPAAATVPLSTAQTGAAVEHGFEFKLGSKFFTGIGAVAVVIGVGFFLRYAFERNLITEFMRIVLGFAAGAGLIGAGEYLRKRFAGYGQVLMGTGLAILYLTLYAASSYYGIITSTGAFIGMVAVTLISALLAVRHDSLPLAGFSQLGGFITPFLAPQGFAQMHSLFLYVALLDVGMLLVALWRSWRALTLGSLFGTAIVYLAWHVSEYSSALFAPAFAYLTLFFLIFLAAVLSRLFVTKNKTDQNDLALVMFNPLFYFLAGYSLIDPLYPDAAGLFAFILSAIHLLIGYIAGRDNENVRHSRYFLYGVGFLLLFVAIPIQFGGSWVTVGWAAEALVLYWLSRKEGSDFFRNSGHVVAIVAGIRFLTVDLSQSVNAPWFNPTGLTFLLAGLCFTAAVWLFRSFDSTGERKMTVDFLALETFVLSFAFVTSQIEKFYPHHWLAVGWSLLAFFAVLVGIFFRLRSVRLAAYAVFALVGFRLLFVDSSVDILIHVPFVNLRVLNFMITILLSSTAAYLVSTSAEVEQSEKSWAVPSFFYAINLLLIWIISIEVLDYYNLRIREAGFDAVKSLKYTKNSVLSVVWALYAVTLIATGIAFKSSPARLFSILLFGLVIFKVFLYDTASLNNLYRFVSFISLGLILLLTGYLYNRYKDRISEFIKSN